MKSKPTGIFISVRIEGLRTTAEEMQGAANLEDLAARDGVLEALQKQGYEVTATGEGKCADAWVKRPDSITR